MTAPIESNASGGRAARSPVIYAGRRIPGLFTRKTSDGRTVYELRRKINGRVVRKTLAATTATDAIREASALSVKLADTALVGRSDATLRELRDAWAEWAKTQACPLAARTVELHSQRLEQYVLPLLGGERMATEVTPARLRAMIDQLVGRGLAGSTVRGCVTAASSLFQLAVRRDVLERNPVRLLERGDRPSAKRRREPRYLSANEIERLLAKLRPEPRAVAATLAFAGLRISEALTLRWQDADLDGGTLHVPGTKMEASRAIVPMIPALVSELRTHRTRQTSLARLRPDALVFQTANGNRQDRKDVLRAIYAAGDAAGLNPPGLPKVGCHSLRHSAAGLLFAAGVPPTKVAAILRHASTRVTLAVYAGLAESGRAELRSDLERAFQ